MSCALQDDLKKFVRAAAAPSGNRDPGGGKTKAKERRKVGERDAPLSWRTRPTRTMMRRRCRTASSCGRGLAVLAYLTSPSCKIHRLV
jgi:hypothetical protein